MPLYEIYQAGKVQPLTTVTADEYVIIEDAHTHRVVFKKERKNIAQFILNNISGFKEIPRDKQEA